MYSVALVDDNRIVLQSIKQSINWAELDCAVCGTAENGIDGLRLLREKFPDIVIMDIMMPGFTGLDVIAMLRDTLPNTCFIVITGYNSIESARKSVRLGIFDYIVKPISNEDLIAVLREAITSIRGKRAESTLPDINGDGGVEGEVSAIRARLSEYAPLVREAISYIDANLFQELSLKRVADAILISPAYLSNLFKKETGKSFLDYVTSVKLCQAKILLRNPRNKVYEVGQMLGYNDYSYFYQVYRKYMGHAPGNEK